MTELRGRILSIAGSDSGGGAGIQADIKAISAMGGYAMTALTAVTVQNTQGVSAIHDIPLETITAQIAAVAEDIGVDAVKTGMLHTAGVITAVEQAIDRQGLTCPVVIDPVMVATSGAKLLENSAVEALKRTLLPRATVLTPNVPEAEVLTGQPIRDMQTMERAAMMLHQMGARAVLMKGGHLGETGDHEVHDLLFDDAGPTWFTHERLDTRNTHGTGCTLASALATLLGQGAELRDAVGRARAYVLEAIRCAPGLGQGYGPLNHFHHLLQA